MPLLLTPSGGKTEQGDAAPPTPLGATTELGDAAPPIPSKAVPLLQRPPEAKLGNAMPLQRHSEAKLREAMPLQRHSAAKLIKGRPLLQGHSDAQLRKPRPLLQQFPLTTGRGSRANLPCESRREAGYLAREEADLFPPLYSGGSK